MEQTDPLAKVASNAQLGPLLASGEKAMWTIDRLDLSVRCDIAFWAGIVNVSVWGSSSHEAKVLGVFVWAAMAACAWCLRKFFERRHVVRA